MSKTICMPNTASHQDLTTWSDEELYAQYRATSQREMFAELVRRYERELFNYLRRYLGNAEMAEDVFQASFLQVHVKRELFETGRSFRPWLYTIALNQAIDAQRRNRRHKMASLDRAASDDGEEVGKLMDLLVSSTPNPAAQADGAERREWIRSALDRLPEVLKQSVHLIYYQGLKYREAADAFGIPVGTVKSRLHAAILKLNEMWNADHPEKK